MWTNLNDEQNGWLTKKKLLISMIYKSSIPNDHGH